MKSIPIVSVLLVMALCVPCDSESFSEWRKEDRKAFETFRDGKPVEARHADLQTEVEKSLAHIDAAAQQRGLLDWQFIVSTYEQVMGSIPSALEIQALTQLLIGDRDRDCFVKLDRNRLVALLIAKKENMLPLDYEAVERNLPVLKAIQISSVPGRQPEPPPFVPSVRSAPPPRPAPLVNDGAYQLYRGYMHAHTGLSDGIGAPEEAYRMAQREGALDFFAVTDHAIYLPVWPWEDSYGQIKKAAEAANDPGRFVALPGFEWSSPVYGHFNVMGTGGYTTCIDSFDLSDFFTWLADRPHAIATLNHPGRLNFVDRQFEHFKLYPAALKQVIGMEQFNSGEKIKAYFDEGFGDRNRYLDEAIQNGWMIGVLGGQDNHKGKWGLRNDHLVGVWAEALTREGILDGHRARRTFAVEDRNLSLSFKFDGAEMGSRLAAGPHKVRITLADEPDDTLATVKLFKRGNVEKEWTVSGADETLTHSLVTTPNDYYYVLAEQQDGDQALSSPIWIIQ